MRGTLVLSAAMAILAVACYTGPGLDRLAAVLDELVIPETWELVKAETHGPGGDVHCEPGPGVGACPAVTRFYRVDAAPSDVLEEATEMTESAGFYTEQVAHPECDGKPTAPACMLISDRDGVKVLVFIYNPGHDLGPEDTSADRTTAILRAG